jgi:Gpi18-like mannosyltransferase
MPTRDTCRAVLLWLAGSRLVIAAIGVIGVTTFLDQHTLTTGGSIGLHADLVWRKWDVLWYERVALHGYRWQLDDLRGQALAGFFPLYPLLVGTLLRLLPFASFFWTGTVVSNVLTAVACALAVQHLADDTAHGRRVLAVTAMSAGSFYLSIPYTESLFLLLVVLVMICTRRRRDFWAAAFAGLGAITRVQGFALLAIPLIACRLDDRLPLASRFKRMAGISALFILPIAIYMVYLSHVRGSAQAFVISQGYWDNAIPYPLKTLVGLVRHARWLSGWLHGSFWALYVALLARYWRRLPLGEALFCAGALLISTQQESFQGIYRYITPLMPLTLAVASDRDQWRQPILIGNVVFATIMILAFVTWNRLAV